MFDQVEERLLAPLKVVEDDHSGRCAAACSSVFRNAQAISSGDVAASVSPSSDANCRRGRLVRRPDASCLSTSTTGQYVIPSP